MYTESGRGPVKYIVLAIIIGLVVCVIILLGKETPPNDLKESGQQHTILDSSLDSSNSPKGSPPERLMEREQMVPLENPLSPIEKIKQSMPVESKRIEMYRDLGILDMECNLMSECWLQMSPIKAGRGYMATVASLFHKKEIAPNNIRRLDYGIALRYCLDQGPVKRRKMEYLKQKGYSSRAVWCSRLAQMHCDFIELYKKQQSDPDQVLGYEKMFRDRAIQALAMTGGYATCVGEFPVREDVVKE